MNRKKLLSLLLSVTMVAALAAPAMAAPADGARTAVKTETDKIVILHTNDVHCQIDQSVKENKETGEKTVTAIGYAGVAAYKAEMEAQYGEGNVTLVDAGDAIQGGPIGTLSKGSYLVDIMNKVGYDLAVPGNHEFDYGMDNFLSLAKERAEYTYICSNFTDLKGNAVFDAYKIVEYGKVKVGFVGIDTPEAFTKSTPTYFQDGKGNYIYSFSEGNGGKDLYAAVQKAVDAAKKAGADYVIAVGHLGENGTTDEWKSSAVAANTTGIDVLIDGHSHEAFEQVVKNKDGKDVQLVQTGTKLANIGKLVIDTKTKTITHEQVSGYAEQDKAVADFVAGINAEFDKVLKEVVATSEVLLTTKDADGNRLVRSGETNLGDLCADAYRVVLGGDVAFVNGGGIRADIEVGDITYGDIINVHPYSNEGCLVEVTGQTILDALELGTRLYPQESGGFLQVSGLTYSIDANLPTAVVVNDKNEFVKVDGEYRVKNVMVGEEPLDLNKTYTVASHNYMLKDGGDGFVMFKGAKLLKDCVMLDNKVLIDYIVEELGGKVTEKDYGKKADRILVIPDALAAYTDLNMNAWYIPALREVRRAGLMDGVSDTEMAPEAEITEATVYQTLYNAAGGDKKAAAGEEWYAPALAWAAEQGIYKAEGQFKDGVISREKTLTILKAYAPQANGLMVGNEKGDMMAQKPLTRAELAQVMVRLAGTPTPRAD